jgi:cholesterol transport system auxiliary component
MNASLRWVIGASLLLGVDGCALFGKSEAFSPRYFSPDARTVAARSTEPPAGSGSAAPIELRLGRITAASYLGERIVFRSSDYELNFYEERRWTEKPENYLRRALSRAFFEARGFRRIVSGPGPTLDVELVEFAEFRLAVPVARVNARYVLSDNRLVRREASVEIEVPIDAGVVHGDGSESGVHSMADALNRAVQQIADQVAAELAIAEPTIPQPGVAEPAIAEPGAAGRQREVGASK